MAVLMCKSDRRHVRYDSKHTRARFTTATVVLLISCSLMSYYEVLQILFIKTTVQPCMCRVPCLVPCTKNLLIFNVYLDYSLEYTDGIATKSADICQK